MNNDIKLVYMTKWMQKCHDDSLFETMRNIEYMLYMITALIWQKGHDLITDGKYYQEYIM